MDIGYGTPSTAGLLCCADLHQQRLRQRQEIEDAALARSLQRTLQRSSRKLPPKPMPTEPKDTLHSKETRLNRSKTGVASNCVQGLLPDNHSCPFFVQHTLDHSHKAMLSTFNRTSPASHTSLWSSAVWAHSSYAAGSIATLSSPPSFVLP